MYLLYKSIEIYFTQILLVFVVLKSIQNWWRYSKSKVDFLFTGDVFTAICSLYSSLISHELCKLQICDIHHQKGILQCFCSCLFH